MSELPLCGGHGAFLVLLTGIGIAVMVFALIAHSIISFSKPADASTAVYVHRTASEVIWAIIPILILIATAMPAVKPLITTSNNCQFAAQAR